jgi:uncharacterized protein
VTSFNVAGLLAEPPGATRLIQLRDHHVALGTDVELAGPVDAELRLQRTNRGILLHGEARATLRRTCARCTDPYLEEVRIGLDEEFLPSIDPATGLPIPLDDSDGAPLRINPHHEIELDGVLHDELLLTEPMHPLCRPDCPGLCPECGERLEAGHVHDDVAIDPRLEALRAFRVDGDDESR